MGISTAEDLCAQPGDKANTGERAVGLARRQEPRTFASAARQEGGSGALKHQLRCLVPPGAHLRVSYVAAAAHAHLQVRTCAAGGVSYVAAISRCAIYPGRRVQGTYLDVLRGKHTPNMCGGMGGGWLGGERCTQRPG